MKKVAALSIALALAGCAAPVASPLPPPGASPAAVRHLLADEATPTRMWGLNYTSTDELEHGVSMDECTTSRPGAYNKYYDGRPFCFRHDGWQVNWSATGPDAFESIGAHGSYAERFIFTVPDDQVLVINEVRGGLSINGFYVGSSAREKVDYLFGAGEVVIFSCTPGAWAVGFTADPALLGAGSKSVRSAK